MGPWILGFSYEIFWRDRKRLRKTKSLFIHPWRRRGGEEESKGGQELEGLYEQRFAPAEGEEKGSTHPKTVAPYWQQGESIHSSMSTDRTADNTQ